MYLSDVYKQFPHSTDVHKQFLYRQRLQSRALSYWYTVKSYITMKDVELRPSYRLLGEMESSVPIRYIKIQL